MPTSRSIHNINNLSPVGFEFSLVRIPNLVWSIQEINVPGVTLGDSSKYYATGKVAIPGDNLEYDELNITFIVDESLNNWREIYNWMRGLAPTSIGSDSSNQYKDLENSDFRLVSDGDLHIMTNTGNPNIHFSFKDLFPMSLATIPMNTTATSIDALTATVSFRYTRFDIDVNEDYNSTSVPGNNSAH
jgi:hypothetical protein